MAIITLLTDFGTKDAYVGSMKGVILSVNPRAALVDLSHEIRPRDVREAALLLVSVYPHFPKKTIHVVVVDPGVGSSRRILCARTGRGHFLAPDNGVLTGVLAHEPSYVLREVTNARFFRKEVSATFHGRDKFAPVAAHLAKDPAVFSRLGPVAKRHHTLKWPRPVAGKRRIHGEVIHIDRFGNLVTNIEERHLKRRGLPRVRLGGKIPVRWARFYSEGKRGEVLALLNSSGRLEIAMREGSAAVRTRAAVGAPVRLSWE